MPRRRRVTGGSKPADLSDTVFVEGRPNVAFYEADLWRGGYDIAMKTMRKLIGTPAEDCMTIPVIFTSPETIDYLGGWETAVAVTDFCDNFGQGNGVPHICLNTALLRVRATNMEDTAENIATTIMHEVGHCVYRDSATRSRTAWKEWFRAKRKGSEDHPTSATLFSHGPEEGFAEIFSLWVLDLMDWEQKKVLGQVTPILSKVAASRRKNTGMEMLRD